MAKKVSHSVVRGKRASRVGEPNSRSSRVTHNSGIRDALISRKEGRRAISKRRESSHVVAMAKSHSSIVYKSPVHSSFFKGMGRAIDVGSCQTHFAEPRFSSVSTPAQNFDDSWSVIGKDFYKVLSAKKVKK
jgi:hypothetical protein